MADVHARYQSCANTEYEGSTRDYCTHLELMHHCFPALLDPFRDSVGEAAWRAVDDLHRTYLAFA